ncbi:hypothetical protein SRABI70_01489 [Pseudomonas sp. Bi70]|nr:hypothetical protein SRABI70_01489 [Pseudomonas sp. Bi70]
MSGVGAQAEQAVLSTRQVEGRQCKRVDSLLGQISRQLRIEGYIGGNTIADPGFPYSVAAGGVGEAGADHIAVKFFVRSNVYIAGGLKNAGIIDPVAVDRLTIDLDLVCMASQKAIDLSRDVAGVVAGAFNPVTGGEGVCFGSTRTHVLHSNPMGMHLSAGQNVCTLGAEIGQAIGIDQQITGGSDQAVAVIQRIAV